MNSYKAYPTRIYGDWVASSWKACPEILWDTYPSLTVQSPKVRDRYLFKFSEELQSRLDNLNERLKGIGLNDREKAELVGILELDQIFTLLNAAIISEF